MSEIKLKPCPSCGGEGIFEAIDIKTYAREITIIFKVKCKKCGVSLPKIYEIKYKMMDTGDMTAETDQALEAAEAWNRRAGQEDNADGI